MTQGSDYIFCLQNKDGLFWKVDTLTGVVSLSAAPYFLDFAPAGWDDMAIQNIRNRRYWGIDRSVSVPLAYVNDGAGIVKYVFYNLGAEEPLYLVIAGQRLDYNAPASGTITVLTGGNLNSGTNTGTVSGTPGTTVYVKLTGSSSVYTTGYVGGKLISGINSVVSILIPISGSVNYNIFSAGVGNALEMTTQNGNAASYGFWYKQIYKGEVDLTTFVHAGARITVTTLEDGLPKYLKANEATTEEFEMNVPDAQFIEFDGVKQHESLNYSMIDNLDIDLGEGNGQILPALFLNNEGNGTGILYQSQTPAIVPITSDVFADAENNNIIVNAGTAPVTFTFSGLLEIICTQDVSSINNLTFRAGIGNAGAAVSSIAIGSANSLQLGDVRQVPVAFSMTVQPGQYLFLYAMSSFTGTVVLYQFTDNSKFKISYTTRFPTTYARALSGQYLFSGLIDRVTEGTYKAAISQFMAAWETVWFTCGNALRGLDDAKMKISWNEFFDFYDAVTGVGIKVMGTEVDMDEKENLVDANTYIDLPQPGVDSFKVSLDKSFLFNELEIGYPELKNEVGVLNGNEEFNTKSLFSLGTTKAPARLIKVSKIKAAPYEIEQVRSTTLNKDTTDFKADNDNFAVKVTATLYPAAGGIVAHRKLDRSLNPGTTGLIEVDTIFNLFLTPKRNLLRNGRFLRSSLYKGDARTLFFKSADKNDKVISAGVIEKADENIGGLGDKFFEPILFDGDWPAPDDLLALLDTNPLQVFRFPFYGNYYKGIMMKTAIAPSNGKEQQFQFLSVPGNNLAALEDYYGG